MKQIECAEEGIAVVKALLKEYFRLLKEHLGDNLKL